MIFSHEQSLGGSRVLIADLGSSFHQSFEADATVYSRHYRKVEALLFSTISDLLEAIVRGYDIVHLFSPLSSGGALTDIQGASLLGSELIEKCCVSDVKLLWIANETNADAYIKGFRAAGRPLNLVMTLNRNGAHFERLLNNLLSKLSYGETLPVAWAALVPQSEGSWQQELPSCIFFAGRGNARLPGVLQ